MIDEKNVAKQLEKLIALVKEARAKSDANVEEAKVYWRIWWTPRSRRSTERFVQAVPSFAAGKAVLETLARYDAFNGVKPECASSGGVAYRFDPVTGDDWVLISNLDAVDDTRDVDEIIMMGGNIVW